MKVAHGLFSSARCRDRTPLPQEITCFRYQCHPRAVHGGAWRCMAVHGGAVPAVFRRWFSKRFATRLGFKRLERPLESDWNSANDCADCALMWRRTWNTNASNQEVQRGSFSLCESSPSSSLVPGWSGCKVKVFANQSAIPNLYPQSHTESHTYPTSHLSHPHTSHHTVRGTG